MWKRILLFAIILIKNFSKAEVSIMGRKSIKENKNRYQQAREEANLTRAAVEDLTDSKLTERKIEKIENGTQNAQPPEVVEMAKLYDKPDLCNFYCTNECEIGKKYVPQVETIHDLPQITLSLLSSLNTLENDKNKIIDIVSDGKVTDDEKIAFQEFKDHLSQMSLAIETLKLWAEKELKLL